MLQFKHSMCVDAFLLWKLANSQYGFICSTRGECEEVVSWCSSLARYYSLLVKQLRTWGWNSDKREGMGAVTALKTFACRGLASFARLSVIPALWLRWRWAAFHSGSICCDLNPGNITLPWWSCSCETSSKINPPSKNTWFTQIWKVSTMQKNFNI